ncbi:MAG: hypothetical protein Q4C87_02290 [Actinomycetaceae bacterium]|nr:hypothetical protein [Actinomycetaceae bacterium]
MTDEGGAGILNIRPRALLLRWLWVESTVEGRMPLHLWDRDGCVYQLMDLPSEGALSTADLKPLVAIPELVSSRGFAPEVCFTRETVIACEKSDADDELAQALVCRDLRTGARLWRREMQVEAIAPGVACGVVRAIERLDPGCLRFHYLQAETGDSCAFSDRDNPLEDSLIFLSSVPGGHDLWVECVDSSSGETVHMVWAWQGLSECQPPQLVTDPPFHWAPHFSPSGREALDIDPKGDEIIHYSWPGGVELTRINYRVDGIFDAISIRDGLALIVDSNKRMWAYVLARGECIGEICVEGFPVVPGPVFDPAPHNTWSLYSRSGDLLFCKGFTVPEGEDCSFILSCTDILRALERE